ncbi:MAG: LysR family transcriptional regulator [Actinomycetia bacterium]|nr:LysR family transcriptional regulator [Actinomycetes bacterium]
MQLDVESLRAFATVLDTGGITRAAEELNLSQSAVSWKIKRLEERVGRDLLVRQGRSIRPSRDGHELLNYARVIIDAHDEAVARLTSSELSGRVNLGATEEVSAECVSAVLGRFNRVHAGVTIEIHVDRGQRLDEMLRAGDLDLALLQLDPEDWQDTDTHLWTDERQWISAPDWTYDTGTVPLVTFGETGFYRPLSERILRAAGIPHRVAFSGPSSASVLAAVEAGLGVAVMSGRSVVGDVIPWPRAQKLAALPPVYQVARVAAGAQSPVVTELLGDLEQELGEVASSDDLA